MAKYTVNYSCGHGSTIKNLFGKTSERERRIAWYEQNLLCPECYKAQQRNDSTSEKIAYLDMISAPIPLLQITVTGQIKANKNALKALGYSWVEIDSGKIPELRLGKLSPQSFIFEDLLLFIKSCRIELERLGYSLADNLSSSDKDLLKRQLVERQFEQSEKQRRLAADPKPKNNCYQFMFERHGSLLDGWNGKIYGNKRTGFYYFYDGEKITINDAEHRTIANYHKKLSQWRVRNHDLL